MQTNYTEIPASCNPGFENPPGSPDTTDHSPHAPARVPTGIAVLDTELEGGVEPGSLNVLCGYTGHGKTTLTTHFAQVAAHMGHPVKIFHFGDLTEREYYQRFTAWERGDGQYRDIPPYPKSHFPRIELEEISPGDRAFMNRVPDLVDGLRGRFETTPVVIFDSLDGDIPERRVLEDRVLALAVLAKQFGAVVWTTSQANEKGRETDTVTLDCLREARGKAFPASMFLGLGYTEADKNNGIVTLTADKNRYGGTLQVRAGVDWAHQRFFDLDDAFELAPSEVAEDLRQLQTGRVKSA